VFSHYYFCQSSEPVNGFLPVNGSLRSTAPRVQRTLGLACPLVHFSFLKVKRNSTSNQEAAGRQSAVPTPYFLPRGPPLPHLVIAASSLTDIELEGKREFFCRTNRFFAWRRGAKRTQVRATQPPSQLGPSWQSDDVHSGAELPRAHAVNSLHKLNGQCNVVGCTDFGRNLRLETEIEIIFAFSFDSQRV